MTIIRILQSNDVDNAAKLLKDMWLMHADNESKLLDKDYINNYNTAEYIRKALEDSKQQFFVAEENGIIVGVARVEIQNFKNMHNFTKLAYFDDLVVRKDYRRRGIASALVEKRINWAKEHGAQACKTKIYKFNSESQKLANKYGFDDIYSYYYKFL
jgi:GNAT superfamily N-acetyltransferase